MPKEYPTAATAQQPTARSEDAAQYATDAANAASAADELVIARAMDILNKRMFARVSPPLVTIAMAGAYCKMKLSQYPFEVIGCLFLDTRNSAIAFQELARGTIDTANLHMRELVRLVLAHNAAAIILCHNHPSGVPEPSRADLVLTERVRDALALIEVRVLDHFVIGADVVSMVERGMFGGAA